MKPRVSVLLPVRDAAATLPGCLDSIAGQSFDDYEVLVVDDHSTDGSVDVVRDHAAADSRIRPLVNPSRGIVAALNAGLAAARSELIARMDADDLMAAGRLALQHGAMTADTRIAVLGSRVEKFPAITDGYREYLDWQNGLLSAGDIDDEIYVEAPFAHPSVMIRRRVLVDQGGYRHGDFPEDYELWLRLHRQQQVMQKLPEVLLRWREGPDRLSRTSSRYRREAFDELRSVYLANDPRFLQRSQDFAIWGAGRRTRKRCARLLARGFRPRAWIDIDPRKIGNRLDGVPVVSPEWLDGRRTFVLAYVASHGARTDIDGYLRALGYLRGRDYLMVG